MDNSEDFNRDQDDLDEPIVAEIGNFEELTEEGPPGSKLEPEFEQMIWGD
jgi:hypothetical protein